MAFFRNLLATILGLFIFSIVAFGIFFIIVVSAISSGEEVPTIKKNSVLYLRLSGVLQERTVEDPFTDLIYPDGPQQIGLFNTLDVLAAAKDDDKIRGILMEPGFIQGGNASLSEIREAIEDFKESGKFVYAYGTYLSEADYYLASVADSLFLNPEGSLELNGLSANLTFYKGAFDKLGVEPRIFKVGKYKSAVEPYFRKDMSDENRYQVKSMLNSIYDKYTEDVSASINKTKEELRGISDKMLVRLPEDAVKYGLVTRLAYEDEVMSLIRDEISISEKKKINFISASKYDKAVSARYPSSGGDEIAVIVAEGEIIMGSGRADVAGDLFASEIRKARKDDDVKAIVIRINSPGGSLTASDIMWREIMLAKAEKPVIASMGDVAASGGYFMAMPCDVIVARPNTITGSIGIFGMSFNLADMLEDKLGITHDVVSTGEFSDINTITRALTPEEAAIIQRGVEKGYETFTTKAAEGRGMTVDAIKEVASGRVWTGEQALGINLIDELGGFDRAIEIAAEKADLSSDGFSVSYYPKRKGLLEEYLGDAGKRAKLEIADEQYGQLAPFIKKLKKLENYQGLQARMPFDLEIK